MPTIPVGPRLTPDHERRLDEAIVALEGFNHNIEEHNRNHARTNELVAMFLYAGPLVTIGVLGLYRYLFPYQRTTPSLPSVDPTQTLIRHAVARDVVTVDAALNHYSVYDSIS